MRWLPGLLLAPMALLSLACRAECLGPTAVDAARALFEKHRDFAFEAPDPTLLAPRLLSLLSDDALCKRTTGETCALDRDPWTDAQDGDIVGPAVFDAVRNSHGSAMIRARFHFVAEPGTRPREKTVTLMLAKPAHGRCWRVEDMHSEQTDLVEMLVAGRGLGSGQARP